MAGRHPARRSSIPALVFLTMRSAGTILAISLALSLGACTGMLFHPQSELLITPDRIGVAYRDITFTAGDGVDLHGWFLPAETGAASNEACTVLFLHGNAENISTHFAAVKWLPGAGYNVFLFDYRGYGRSAGKPSLPGLHLDAEAAFDTVFAMPDVDPGRIVVFGQSLGGAVAITALAQSKYRHPVRALITEGAFSSYRGIMREKLAGLWLTWPLQAPLSMTMNNDYKPLEAIGTISPVPVLIIHGTADVLVPPHHADALYEAAGEPKEIWLLPDVAHIQATLEEQNRRRLAEYLTAHCAAVNG
jgi:fermentation-respiration switch protein FrsA (DUF1100 family)